MKTDPLFFSALPIDYGILMFSDVQIRGLVCEECGQKFKSIRGLRQHEGKIHTKSEKEIKCSFCEKLFKNRYSLKAHNDNVHNRSKRFACNICEKVLYSKYTFKNHLKVKHPISLSLD